MRVHCHLAFGKTVEIEDDCPLHVKDVTAVVKKLKNRLVLELQTPDRKLVEELRKRAAKLLHK